MGLNTYCQHYVEVSLRLEVSDTTAIMGIWDQHTGNY